jgi:D-serine deaminase-like pyridoxal phosphate-dependent protein
MNPLYAIDDVSSIFSPALIFYEDLIRKNIAEVIRLAGSPDRLRPHVKTHKTREIVRLEQEAGITKHKCATLAEAEMLASCEAADVLIAYPLVGPNTRRLARLMWKYPRTRFSALVDHPQPAQVLSEAMAAEGLKLDVLIDVDVGQHRTGIPPGDSALALYEQVDRSRGLRPAGFHVYDGHNHQESLDERRTAVEALLGPVLALRAAAEKKGLAVPRLVCGGTPTFAVFARMELRGLECSPGTFVLHDHGYGSKFAELAGITPAAVLLTRVISRPSPTRVTLDLGYKAVASDPPAGKRCVLLDVPDYTPGLQNEEHFVIETPAAERFAPGDVVFAIPTHICPTCAMHQRAYVVEGGRVTGTWDIAARDRVLSI